MEIARHEAFFTELFEGVNAGADMPDAGNVPLRGIERARLAQLAEKTKQIDAFLRAEQVDQTGGHK